MPDPIRVAVIGYGLAGRVFHCPFVSAIPGLSLEAIVQRHGNEAAETYPHARILRSPEAALADPAVDLIIVATPNETHESLARAALEAGKHVVVDKPLAPTSAAVLALAETAKAAGKHLIPFHNRRWDGDFLTLQALLQDEKLGRIVKVISHWDRFRPTPREGTWKENPGNAHGILQDLGPHLLDQALTLFGQPQRLTASIRKDRDGSEIEDAFDIVLTYDAYAHPHAVARPALLAAPSPTPLAATHPTLPTDAGSNPPSAARGTHATAASLSAQPGVAAGFSPRTTIPTAHQGLPPGLQVELHATMIAADPAPRFQVHGTRGSFSKCGLDPQEAHLVADGRHPPTFGSSVPWIEDAETAWGTLTLAPDPRQPAILTRERIPTLPGDYRLFYAAVRDAILANTAPPVTAIDAFRVARLIELARQSSHERRTLDVHFN